MSEVDLRKMISIVFSKPPAEPRSYKLDLSINTEENESDFSDKLAKTTSNVLMNIFISGCQILFGNEVTPTNITESQFKTVNKYINSFGYETNYEYTYKELIGENGETIKKPSNLNVYFTII